MKFYLIYDDEEGEIYTAKICKDGKVKPKGYLIPFTIKMKDIQRALEALIKEHDKDYLKERWKEGIRKAIEGGEYETH